MSEILRILFAEAMQLSRDGRCSEATALIQRAFHLVRPQAQGKPAGQRLGLNPDDRIIKGNFEFVEDIGPGGGFIIHGRYHHGPDACDYRLYVPSRLDGPPAALLLMLHGCQQDATSFAALTRMDRLADAFGFIVLYPNQGRPANSVGCWNWFLSEHRRPERGESALLVALTDEIAGRYAVERRRRYVAGFSAGAAMALILAAVCPDRFSAIGVHSGLPYGVAHDQLSALALMRQGPVGLADLPLFPSQTPIIVFQGDADIRVNPANAAAIIQQALGGLGRDSEQLRTEQRLVRTENRWDCSVMVCRDAQARSWAELWMVHGGGHGWFGGDPQMAFAEPKGPDASRELVRFFFAVSGIHQDE